MRTQRGRLVLLLAGLAACGTSAGGPDGASDRDMASPGDARGVGDIGTLGDMATQAPTLPMQSGPATFAGGGREETAVHVILPSPRPAHPPLLLVFHGTGGEPADAVNDFDLQARADALGFAAIAPRAGYRDKPHPADVDHPADSGGSSWNMWTADPAANDDLLYVRALIDAAAASWGADTRRVYTMGFSNGAYMSWFVAASLPDRVAGFAENSGGWTTDACPTRTDMDGTSLYLQTYSAPPGQDVTCAQLFAQPSFPSQCRVGGSNMRRPPTPPGRAPFGLIGHYASDDTVSVVWSCLLAESLGGRARTRIRNSEADGTSGHAVIPGFVDEAWTFFAGRTVSD